MVSTPITLTQNDAGYYQTDFVATSARTCVAAVFDTYERKGIYGEIKAYLLDANLPKPAALGFDRGNTPSLWLNLIPGMKIRIIADQKPIAVTLITE